MRAKAGPGHIDSDREATRSCSLLKRPIRFTHRLATPPEETTRADPRVPSRLDGGTGEDVESDPFRFLSDGGRSRRARSFRRLSVTRPDPTPARSPTPPDLRRSGSYSVPSASAWRKRGEIVESERLHVSSPALPSDRGGGLAQPPSADVRVGSRRRRAEAGRYRAPGAWGCRVESHHPRPPSLPSLLFLQAATHVVVMEGVSGERHLRANVARFGQQCALRKRGASRLDR